jgi:large subunit ribosomal protein L33
MSREIITLACTSCKRRNYTTTKDRRRMPSRFEIKKFCRFERSHTLHRETR